MALVVAIVATLSVYHFSTIARLSLEETALRGDMLASLVFQRARQVTVPPGTDLGDALRADGALRSILESTMAFGSNVTSAGIVDANGVIIAQAGYFGGWALYMKAGRVVHDYNFFGLAHSKVASEAPLSPGGSI